MAILNIDVSLIQHCNGKNNSMKAGIGWQGKNSLIINPDFGSYMFLGEIFSDLDLPLDKPIENLCGTCDACIKACPTGAIVEPFKIDARRCIAYIATMLMLSNMEKSSGKQRFDTTGCGKIFLMKNSTMVENRS